jgi:hypothetical protein
MRSGNARGSIPPSFRQIFNWRTNLGCGQKAVADDEDDWNNFKKFANINDVNWRVYNQEAGFAVTAYNKSKYTGRRLKLEVKHMVEEVKLKREQYNEINELLALEKLEAKYK